MRKSKLKSNMGHKRKKYHMAYPKKTVAAPQEKASLEYGVISANPFVVKALITKMEYQGKIEYHKLKKRVNSNRLILENRYQALFPRLPASKDMRTETGRHISKTLFKRLGQVLLAFYRLFDSAKVTKEEASPVDPTASKLTKESTVERFEKRCESIESESHETQTHWQAAKNMAALITKIKGEQLQTNQVLSNTDNLSFNPNLFKVDRETTILSEEARVILQTLPDKRSPEAVRIVINCLQNAGLDCFCNYPVEIQKMIAKIAGYMVVTPKRVIIRQGILAEHFYFIIRGRVMIRERYLKKDGTEGEKTTILQPGTNFGELDMVNHRIRKFSATSVNIVQLLTIDREDILKEFTSYKYDIEMPDHIKFLVQCKFMQFWPIDCLGMNLQHCFVYFFKRDVVVLEDSHDTDWIYIMKKGICRVVKKLKRPPKQRINFSNDRLKFVINANTEQIFKLPLKKRYNKGNIVGSESVADSGEFSKSMSNMASDERSCNRQKPGDNGNNYVNVQIDLLKCRDVFGLDTLIFDEYYTLPATDSVSLVSGGAEIVLLSKNFFIKNASELVKWQVRRQANSYPNNKDLDVKLESQQMWNDYKKIVMSELVSGKIKQTPKLWK